MARVRSPNYPAISLPDAIERTAKAFAKENRHPAQRDVMVKALGFGGVNGASLGALSAVVKFGLLDKVGENYRVSDRAMAILHPRSADEKSRATMEAARAPALFSEILDQFPGGLPSDDNLRAYLIRGAFAPSALPAVLKSLRDTMELAFPGGTSENLSALGEQDGAPSESRMQPQVRTQSSRPMGPSEIPAPGISQATLSLSEGTVVLAMPVRLSQESLEDLKDWIATMVRRAERVAKRTQGAAQDDDSSDAS